ncbi:N-6 DNA methylase [Angustibacter luteus]|uniref:site-specific DNA-methyltransferase (adenine-specific) n=1 Tax=Angustibacter luteus TaxID=658456 RepID=A0ABW1JH61_9ACTN
MDDALLGRLEAAATRVEPAGPDGDAWRRASVLAELDRAVLARHGADVLALAGRYDQLLELAPVRVGGGDGGVRWQRVAKHGRRRLGAFATPPQLAAALADRALPTPRANPPAVLDPACGAGALLLVALDRLVGQGLAPDTAVRCLHGVDVDPTAVALARAAVVAGAVRGGADPATWADLLADVAHRIVVGDALVDTPAMTWRTTFTEVLARPGPRDPVTGWSGGFDVVLANPPWERLKVPRAEHQGDDLDVQRGYVRDRVRAVREGGRHPLTGSGDLNAHLPFLETCWRLLADGGTAALLVPEGAVTDRQAGALVRALLDADALVSVHTLADRAGFVGAPGVRAALITLRRNGSGASKTTGAEVLTRVADARDPQVERARSWRLTADLVRRVNPGSGTAVLFRSGRDAALVAAAHERFGVLLERDRAGDVVHGRWGFRARTPIHLSREARHVRTAAGAGLLPLGEAKLAGLLDPRAATWDGGRVRPPTVDELADPGWSPRTRWWVPTELVEARYGDLLTRGWLAGYRIVSTDKTARTLLPVAVPAGAYANSLALLESPDLPLLLAAFASIPIDYVARAKSGGHNLSLFKVEQLPVPGPGCYQAIWRGTDGLTLGEWALRRLADAVGWCAALAPLAGELGLDVVPPVPSPQARALALADLDALHAHLLGWTTSDLEHVLGTFGALRAADEARSGRFVTRERVLAAFERLTPAA